MPYINAESRKKLDTQIEQLIEIISEEAKEKKDDLAIAGMINYTCSRISLGVFLKTFDHFRYKFIALFTGIFENIKQEFYRRVAEPYEGEANWEHGDLPEFIAISKRMAEEREFAKKNRKNSPKK